MKKLLIILLAGLLAGDTFAQDKIFKSNGNVIDVRIKNVGASTIIYSRFDNPNGPEYTILKSEVDKIKYENGSEESFLGNNSYAPVRERGFRQNNLPDNGPMKMKLPPNILAFAPIQFTENGIVGLSVSIEHNLDNLGIAALYLPAILEFNTSNTSTTNSMDPMFYLMPGIKIYPTGCYGMAKYAVGPSLVLAAGQKSVGVPDPFSPYAPPTSYVDKTHSLLGIMVNQSINLNPTPRFYLCSEFGIGYTYVDLVGGARQDESVLVQFCFKLGFRY